MKKDRNTSFQKQMVSGLLCAVLPLIGFLIFYNFYSIELSNRKIADSNKRMADFCVSQIQGDLSTVDDFLGSIAGRDNDFLTLMGGTTVLQAHLSAFGLVERFRSALASYKTISGLFVCSIPSGTYRDLYGAGVSYEEKQLLRQYVEEQVALGGWRYSEGWKTTVLNGKPYLFRLVGSRGTYVAAVTTFDQLLSIGDWFEDGNAVVAYCTEDGIPITETEFLAAEQITLSGEATENYLLLGNPKPFMVIGRTIPETDVSLYLLLDKAGYFDGLNGLQTGMLILSLMSILIVPLGIYWLRKSILSPLSGITRTIEQIKAGNLDAQIETGNQIAEFTQVNETFNSMMGQIKALKIAAYENQLERQRAELQYLQLQIRPHFFLNCLKGLYASAQQQRYDRVQQMILSISNHIRYIFKDNLELVPLRSELEHVRNYMEIQRLNVRMPPDCEIQVPEELLDFPIPPLVIQTFVENSVKHELRTDRELHILIKILPLESEGAHYLNISVSDDGDGFPTEMLGELNSVDGSIYAENHVGLRNIKHRLRLLYGSDVSFGFFNNPGSVSEIIIPMKQRKEGEQRAGFGG